MRTLALGIDLGTSATKAALVDPEIGLIAQESAEADRFGTHPGWAEADTQQWWRNVCALVPQVLGHAGAQAQDVAAVAVTGMVPAVIPVGANGEVLRRAILQNDTRAGTQVETLTARLKSGGFNPVAETGSAITQQSVGPTLMWLAQYETGTWNRTRSVLGSYEWLAVALGADRHLERNWALESGLFPIQGTEPITDVLEAAGIDPELLAPVREPGTAVGSVSAAAAAETGLRAGTPIVVGGADHVLSAYAAGLSEPGEWIVKIGSAVDILAVSNQPIVDPGLYLDVHPQPGLWLPNGCMATSGSAAKWLGHEILGEKSVDVLAAEAEAAKAGEVIVLPFLLGEKSPWNDPDLRGAVLGLRDDLRRGDLYRGVLEGTAYGLRHLCEIFAQLDIDLKPQAAVTNGGSRSRVGKQIIADVLQTPLIPIIGHPGASLGAAVLAAYRAGLIDDLGQVKRLVTRGEPILPDPALAERYTETYQIYRRAADALVPISHSLARRSTSP